jgi:Asp-tRNA(Asn)/Glu-tRNA(Gln) amidotransferase A subunit family amidase
MGSRLAAGFTPDRDSFVMERLRRPGFIKFRRTTTTEPGLTLAPC